MTVFGAMSQTLQVSLLHTHGREVGWARPSDSTSGTVVGIVGDEILDNTLSADGQDLIYQRDLTMPIEPGTYVPDEGDVFTIDGIEWDVLSVINAEHMSTVTMVRRVPVTAAGADHYTRRTFRGGGG